ncbi:hypothetical protein [Nocardia carnea]|uniref:hypothetical protein n=1 Tax=Nocardia carnea TaxID=37328 RepID=UPI00245807FB|nr:hypothetical protein [Nocardia carnea]
MKLETAAFGLHSHDGIALGAVECPTDYTWSRELNEVSRLSLAAPVQEVTEQVIPFVHWISCWHGQRLQWVGPIETVDRDRSSMQIEARDLSTLMWRTRTQITREWTQLDVGPIAADIWRDMLELHEIDADPIVLPAASEQGRYNVAVKADLKMVHQDMAELSKLGLRWTVVAGRPVLGTQPAGVVAELEECHISEGARIRRSAKTSANDVRVQGQNSQHTVRLPMGGLRLQAIVSLDDLRGTNNIAVAAEDRARRTAVIRDELVIPSSATLTPDAPVELDQLVPGVHISVSALGLRSVLRVDQLQVTGSPNGMDVAVTLSTPEVVDELARAGGQVVS